MIQLNLNGLAFEQKNMNKARSLRLKSIVLKTRIEYKGQILAITANLDLFMCLCAFVETFFGKKSIIRIKKQKFRYRYLE
ncbi:hypothetical protein BpHYR1_028489 [Brachionus plicatilis]|uniref:Uncharacterized protein n=1 Tax=Brachionus plicatilis TaxID=10195 RepID=A0A3M7R3M9_BRAPC|nr:hypothetical protein BpHYR1_028489 [Brachionus plicatilis]